MTQLAVQCDDLCATLLRNFVNNKITKQLEMILI